MFSSLDAKFDDWAAEARFALEDEIQALAAEATRATERSVTEAHWHLNELEHELQGHALGYFWQWFVYPYGSRRNAGEKGYNTVKEFYETLPKHHQGDSTRSVDTEVGYEYPVGDYLRHVERRDYWFALYLEHRAKRAGAIKKLLNPLTFTPYVVKLFKINRP